MAGKSRQKSAANVVENVTLTVNERILKDCHSLYTDTENGENKGTYKTRKCESAKKKLIIKCESTCESTFAVYSPSLQYLLRATDSYTLTNGRMMRVCQQNYRPTSTDVAERAVV